MTISSGLILGFGNSLRGDDAIGPRLAEDLVTRLPHIRVLPRHQLTVELCEDLARASWVIFVDAHATLSPGEFTITQIEPDLKLPCVFSHHLSPGALLACAQQFFGSTPAARLFAIGVASMETGEHSTFTDAQLRHLAGQVAELASALDLPYALPAHA